MISRSWNFFRIAGLALISLLGNGFWAGSFAQAEENANYVRVAVLRDIPKFEDALAALCKREYQGAVRLVHTKNGAYTAVNTLDVEDFVLSVIGREMDAKGPLEALKAQAIAARSHALYQASISVDQPYDLVANLSQAYIGKCKLEKNVVLAIESTRGQVIYFQGKPIPAFFHDSCGGHTESIGNVWPCGLKLPGTAACASCAQTSQKKWAYEFTASKLQKALKEAGYKIGVSPTVEISRRSSTGHVTDISVESGGKTLILSAERLRSILGYRNLKSTVFNIFSPVTAEGIPSGKFIFRGDGNGHGVGLCQFGAHEMAQKGASCNSILSHYFPDCRIRPSATETLVSAR